MPEDKNQTVPTNQPTSEFTSQPTGFNTDNSVSAPPINMNPGNEKPDPGLSPISPINPVVSNSESLNIETEPTSNVSSETSVEMASFSQEPASVADQPAPAFPAAIGTTSTSEPPAKRSKKRLVIALVSILSLGLLGGSGAAAYSMWYQAPERVLADAAMQMIQAKAVTYEGDLLFESKDSGYKLQIRINGKGDRANNSETIDVKVAVDGKTYPLKASFMQTENSVFYFKIDNLKSTIESYQEQGTELPAAAIKLIDAIDGKWIKITLEDIKEWGQEMADLQKCTGDVFRETKNDDEVYKELANVYAKHPFLTAKGDIKNENGNLNFEIDTNESELKKFVSGLNDTKLFAKLQKCDKDSYTLDPKDYEEEEDSEEEKSTVRVSISQWGHELREISASYRSKDGSETGSLSIKPQIVNSITLDEPKDAMSLDDLQKLIEDLQKEMYGDIVARAEDSVNQANANSVIKRAEAYNAINAEYPTLAQLKAATDEAELTSELKSLVSAKRPTAASSSAIQFVSCNSGGEVTGGYVAYYNANTKTVEEIDFGVSCSSRST